MRKTKELTSTALFAALIFVGTYFFKIPLGFAGGYTHLGDCLLILSVLFLGWKYGSIAAAIGMGLSDLIGGFVVWVLPTTLIKGLWACIIGLFAYKLGKNKPNNWYLGAAIGGVLQVFLYTLCKIPLYGTKPALIELPIVSLQTIIGIVLAAVIYHISRNSLPYQVISK